MAGGGRAARPPDLARAARVRRGRGADQAAAVQHRVQPGPAERPGPVRQPAAPARRLAAAAAAAQPPDAAGLRAQAGPAAPRPSPSMTRTPYARLLRCANT